MNLKKANPIWIFLFIGLLIYSIAIISSFQYDSIASILLNPEIKDIKKSFLDIFTHLKSSRRFVYFTFAINWLFFGDKPFTYKLFNVILHIFTSYFLYLIIINTKLNNSNIEKHKKNFALFIGLLFLVLPIQIQSVTYAVQRLESMVGFCYLGALYFYIKFRKEEKNKFLYYFFGLLLVLIGARSKETMVTFPIVLIAYNILFYKSIKLFVLPYVFSGFLPLFFRIFFSVKDSHKEVFTLVAEKPELTRVTYLFTEFKVILKYIGLMILPIGQRVDYSIKIEKSFLSLMVIIPFIILVMILSVGIYYYKKDKFISFSIFLFFSGLVVTSSIIPIDDVIYEHRAYISTAGFAMFFVYMIFTVFKNRKLCNYLMIALLLVYSTLTISRNLVWYSMTSLWEDNYKKEPELERVMINLISSATIEKKYDLAEKYLRIAAKKYPKHKTVVKTYIEVMKNNGKIDNALIAAEDSLKKDVADNDIKLMLIDIYLTKNDLLNAKKVLDLTKDSKRKRTYESKLFIKKGDLNKAFEKVKDIDSINEAKSIKAYIYHQKGELKKAKALYKQSLEIEESVINLADIVSKEGDKEKAIKMLKKLERTSKNNENLYLALIEIDKENEQEYLNKLEKLNNGLDVYYYKLGMVEKDKNNLNKALEYFIKAVEYNPYLKESYYWIGEILYSSKRYDELLDIFSKTKLEEFYYIYGKLGDVYVAKNDLKKALDFYEKAIKLKETKYFIKQLANLSLKINDLERAKIYFEKILIYNENDYDANYNIGVIFYKSNDFKNALIYFEKANTIKNSLKLENIIKKLKEK